MPEYVLIKKKKKFRASQLNYSSRLNRSLPPFFEREADKVESELEDGCLHFVSLCQLQKLKILYRFIFSQKTIMFTNIRERNTSINMSISDLFRYYKMNVIT